MKSIAMFVLDGVRVLSVVLLLAAVRAYQLGVSPWLPRSCRFQPTCSQYALLAIRRDGPVVGVLKTVGRIARCHPWSDGGWDPP